MKPILVIENMVFAVCATATTLGLYAMGAGWWAIWGLAFLLFVNYTKTTK